MDYCTKCGKELSENAKYCTACGTPAAEKGPEEKFEMVAEDLVEKVKTVINEGKFEEATDKFIQKVKTLIKEGEAKKANKTK